MSTKTTWSPALLAAVRKELAGNTRIDLLDWARRVLRNPPSRTELARAKLVLKLAEEN